MNIYLYALIGGLLIGLAVMFLLLLNGRIAGISGIYWTAISSSSDKLWRWLFIAGLPIGAMLSHWLFDLAPPIPHNSYLLACIGGLFVGIGVKIGSGCTSGHGVCGIGRLSLRSLVATIIFMSTGILTVFIVRMASL